MAALLLISAIFSSEESVSSSSSSLQIFRDVIWRIGFFSFTMHSTRRYVVVGWLREWRRGVFLLLNMLQVSSLSHNRFILLSLSRRSKRRTALQGKKNGYWNHRSLNTSIGHDIQTLIDFSVSYAMKTLHNMTCGSLWLSKAWWSKMCASRDGLPWERMDNKNHIIHYNQTTILSHTIWQTVTVTVRLHFASFASP